MKGGYSKEGGACREGAVAVCFAGELAVSAYNDIYLLDSRLFHSQILNQSILLISRLPTQFANIRSLSTRAAGLGTAWPSPSMLTGLWAIHRT